ncbi:hypothetical protein HDG40_001764 [Paraburkholderia sp. JPY158]|uniref:DUF1493 family protein n=1 Tax=Paraburkholderia atlantica TaxID=2654982 RepID=A0A7W8Q4J6_PARAM|nr:DUF1493 family protein [Paraburkholderia atlantica]MBB5423620.1 hypothetical protein [Paraburkholderia atlantica]
MMPPPEVSAELEEFLREKIGIPPKIEIKPSSSLEDDFGVTGDDASKLINTFAITFNVQPGDFEFLRYFNMEGFSVWPFSILTRYLLKLRGVKDYKNKEPITVGMLQRAIELGVWDSQRVSEARSASPGE